jgi:hypothetical protein
MENAKSAALPWEIRPFEGVGPLSFGMKRNEVRSTVREEPRPFRKALSEGKLTDAYEKPIFHAHFDDADCLEFVEFGEPSAVTLNGQRIFALEPTTAEKYIRLFDHELSVDDEGFDSFSLGITVFVTGGHIEGVGVCSRDYAKRMKASRGVK